MIFLQTLERRLLLAAAPPGTSTVVTNFVTFSLSDGILTVNGSGRNERINVRQTPTQVEITAYGARRTIVYGPTYIRTHWSDIVKRYAPAGISEIRVNTLDGDDRVDLVGMLPTPHVDLGDGHDTGTASEGAGGFMFGGIGNDTLDARGNAGVEGGFIGLDGGAGADWFYGSLHTTVDYSTRTAPLVVDQNVARGDGEAGENDHVDRTVANLILGSGPDRWVGVIDGKGAPSGGENSVLGGDGNDTLLGGAGQDFLYGEDGNDLIVGGDNRDWLYGDDGQDTLVGSMTEDMFFGGEMIVYV